MTTYAFNVCVYFLKLLFFDILTIETFYFKLNFKERLYFWRNHKSKFSMEVFDEFLSGLHKKTKILCVGIYFRFYFEV